MAQIAIVDCLDAGVCHLQYAYKYKQSDNSLSSSAQIQEIGLGLTSATDSLISVEIS